MLFIYMVMKIYMTHKTLGIMGSTQDKIQNARAKGRAKSYVELMILNTEKEKQC